MVLIAHHFFIITQIKPFVKREMYKVANFCVLYKIFLLTFANLPIAKCENICYTIVKKEVRSNGKVKSIAQ